MKSPLSPAERHRKRKEAVRARSYRRFELLRLGKWSPEKRVLSPKEEKEAETKRLGYRKKIEDGKRARFMRRFTLVEGYMDGKTIHQLSREFRISQARVYEILLSCGVSARTIRGIIKDERDVKKLSARKSIGERFMEKLEVVESGCWIWKSYVDPSGYARFCFKGKNPYAGTGYAHRFSYEFFSGNPIPDDLEIDHVCRVRKCVNPDHLQVVTHRENVLRGMVPHTAKENIKKAHAARWRKGC